MSHNCAYVRQHYQVPAEIGRRVIAYGKPGVILADRGHYIGVVLDEATKKRIANYHPTHGFFGVPPKQATQPPA
jgi:hypothetical protein